MKALYGYFGEITEHNLKYPGHPLYQLNLLSSLSNYFGIDKFDILHYTDDEDRNGISIHADLRSSLLESLVGDRYRGVLPSELDYDIVILKHRFRNLSRLHDTRLSDVSIYEEMLDVCRHNGIPTYVIDSDFSIHPSFWRRFPHVKILSFADNLDIYPRDVDVTKLSPTSDVLLRMIPTEATNRPHDCFVYDGNPYFKDSMLIESMEVLLRSDSMIEEGLILGKGWKEYPIYVSRPVEHFGRDRRIEFYKKALMRGACTVNITKKAYEENRFVSPRIVEAFILGVFPLVPSGYTFMPEDLRFSSISELREKAFFFCETYNPNLLLKYAYEMFRELRSLGFEGIHDEL